MVAPALLAACQLAAPPAMAGQEQLKGPMGREYFLYLPDKLDRGKTYWLVVGVHGYRGNGKGAAGMTSWVKKGNCIVVGPSFPDGYQGLMHETDGQLIGIFRELRKKYPLHEKMFLYGFSGGSQFAHRFAMRHPELVVGCAAHSGGTWGRTSAAARCVPLAVSCGEADRTRLEGANRFFAMLKEGGFYYKARIWPNVAHRPSEGSRRITEECFVLATTGMYPGQREAVDAEAAHIDALIGRRAYREALQRLGKLSRLELPDANAPARPAGPGGPAEATAPSENAWGWHEGAEGKAALRKALAATLAPVVAARMDRIERVGLAKADEVEKTGGAGALRQLDRLRAEFAGAPKTAARIAALTTKLSRAIPASRPASAPAADANESAARSKLNLARLYLSTGNKAKAAELLRALIKAFPQTPAAAEARAELAKLGAE